MAKQFAVPQHIKVNTNVNGAPASLVRKDRRQKVIAIYQRWRLAGRWWDGQVERDYFMVRTNTIPVCDIFRDAMTGHWHLSKIYD